MPKPKRQGPPPGYTTQQPIHYVEHDVVACACGKKHVRIWKE